jgi:cation-transporting ATPase E
VLSGDNPETVRATVSHLNLPLAREPVAAGDALAAASAEDRERMLRERSVFGRVAPRQKVEILETLQREGSRVAMIGDGVNDVLSIKQADLGIAMGEGASAAKTVAALVLENNRFELLPETLDEGRTILRNLRRAGKLFLTKNVYFLFLVIVGVVMFHQVFPALPQQVTLLNALTIGMPAFLITLGRARAPAVKTRYLAEVGWFSVTTGLIVGLAGLVVMLLSRSWFDADDELQRTLLLSTLVLLGLGSLFRSLTDRERTLLIEDLPLWCWIGAAVLLYLIVMYWPVSARFFELMPLTESQWGLVAAVAVPAFVVCKLLDWLFPLMVPRSPNAAEPPPV